ncbi:FMN-dependent alpha-hydroxy acid dehydrogenase [Byssothecium circinans]|uniref:FMN-dependent alpha-hydroxy acid dehydrogenase n=1 Tax=Byssothecium circinans TaxID=147558 RepID=A0A6A5TND3_9PLEO|nr:FMN-dependent alpha-hydroxy acid dehydrogenase [Byssothecium circinans]
MSHGHATHHRAKFADHKPEKDAYNYEMDIYHKILSYERPPLTFQATEWQHLDCERMSSESKGYNKAAFKKWSIVPNRLTGYKMFPDLTTEILGEKLQVPFAMAPVGVLRIFNPEGEIAATKAAAKTCVPYILSTASSTSTEDVAQANGEDGQRWYQLYWPNRENDAITISLLKRAKKAGFTTLFVTLDTYLLGWRPSDMDNGYNPFLRADQIGAALGFSDPVFRRQYKEGNGIEVEEDMGKAAAEWMKIVFNGFSHSWKDVKFLQEHWDGPIVLKGIQTVADAERCVDIGVQGIVVSNHGGRQQDGGNSSLGMLPHIVDAVGQKLTVLFDSGVRCGADIAKALALGAECVLIGRPYVYGLTLRGEGGVEHVLKSLIGDLELTLHLAGIPSGGKKDLN